jgi:preprotein translocase subunit SecE
VRWTIGMERELVGIDMFIVIIIVIILTLSIFAIDKN